MSRPYVKRTPAEIAEAAAYFDGLSTKEIRRRQGLCNAQLRRAAELEDIDAGARLLDMEADLMAAMLRRC